MPKKTKMKKKMPRMGPKKKSKKKSMGKKKGGGRCWTGYKPVPGKKPFSKGSCAKAN